MVTASVASSPGGLVDLITIHLPASIFLGFLEAVSQPSPLPPQGLCTCCVTASSAFHSDTCRAHSPSLVRPLLKCITTQSLL